MYHLKNNDEIDKMREGGVILSKLHGVLASYIKPGIMTKEIDSIAEEFILDNKSLPSFKGYNGFPASICVSINSEVVHGIPSSYILSEGDIVSVDCGVNYKGFHTDSAYTYCVGDIGNDLLKFLKISKESLYLGIDSAIVGNRIGDIGYSVQSYIENNGYSVVRDLVGHGIGRNLHEEPDVPNYGRRGNGIKLKAGMVLAIEVMINYGSCDVECDKNGVYKTVDGSFSAHFENTVALFDDRTELLTNFDYIN